MINPPTYSELQKLTHTKQIMFALFCAKQVLHLVEEKHKEVCQKAIETAELFLEGKASKEDCKAAASTAHAAAHAAASAAATYATYAAHVSAASAAATYVTYAASAASAHVSAAAASAAASAASDAAKRTPTIEAQWTFYDQLLNGDKYFEEIVLDGVKYG